MTTITINPDGSLTIAVTGETARQQLLLKDAGAEIKRGVNARVTYDEASGQLRVELPK